MDLLYMLKLQCFHPRFPLKARFRSQVWTWQQTGTAQTINTGRTEHWLSQGPKNETKQPVRPDPSISAQKRTKNLTMCTSYTAGYMSSLGAGGLSAPVNAAPPFITLCNEAQVSLTLRQLHLRYDTNPIQNKLLDLISRS